MELPRASPTLFGPFPPKPFSSTKLLLPNFDIPIGHGLVPIDA
jgi:hypothetical protein